jgi:hypothetical protein
MRGCECIALFLHVIYPVMPDLIRHPAFLLEGAIWHKAAPRIKSGVTKLVRALHCFAKQASDA